MSSTALKLAELSQRVLDEWKTSHRKLSEIIADKAKEHTLNKQEIARLVEASNTGAMLYLYKKTNDKTVEFEIAKAEEVGNLLDSTNSSKSSSYYDKDEVDYTKTTAIEELDKEAEAKSSYPNRSAVSYLLKKASAHIETVEKELEELRTKVATAELEIPRLLNKVAHSLREGRLAFKDLENSCLHKFGEEAVEILTKIASLSYGNNKRLLEKEATYETYPETDLVGSVLNNSAFVKQASYDAMSLQSKIDYMKKQYATIGKQLHV